jgi:hypothetical protein
LLSGEKGMAFRTNFDLQLLFGRSNMYFITASTPNDSLIVRWMDILLHLQFPPAGSYFFALSSINILPIVPVPRDVRPARAKYYTHGSFNSKSFYFRAVLLGPTDRKIEETTNNTRAANSLSFTLLLAHTTDL